MANHGYRNCNTGKSIPITVPDIMVITLGGVQIGPLETDPFRVEWRLRRDVGDSEVIYSFMRVEQNALYDEALIDRFNREWTPYNLHLFGTETASESLFLIDDAYHICHYDVHPEFFGDGYKESHDIDKWMAQKSFLVRSRGTIHSGNHYYVEIEKRIGDYLFRVSIREQGSPWSRIMIVFNYVGEQEQP